MNWINNIAKTIDKAFNVARPKLNKVIAPILLICEVKNRPGLSAIALASAVIKRLSEAGIETGVNADGTPNKVNKFVRIFSEEIVKEFKDNAQITCALESGVVSSLGTGANSGGPVVVKSVNTFPINIYGLLQ